MTTIAEGIEFDVQRDTLRDRHCDYGQGYLFSRPLELAKATSLLAQLEPVAP